ncbi:MAG TPA: Brp/Blh family beta-carotene 15,15'-dioxygenase, partial [Gemmatirosa sp.]
GEGVGFGYVLPYTEREALIEIAVIADAVPAPGTLDAALARYVARMTRGAPHVVRWREAGAIPMDAGLAGGTVGAHAADAVECLAVPALAAAFPPFVSFLLYFAVLHSARHAMTLAATLDPARAARAWAAFVRAALPATLATLALALGAWHLLRAGHSPPTAAAVRVLFAGLAALTAPHMALTMLADAADRA